MRTIAQQPRAISALDQAIQTASKVKSFAKENAQVAGLMGILVAAMAADTSILKAAAIGTVSYLLIRWGKR